MFKHYDMIDDAARYEIATSPGKLIDKARFYKIGMSTICNWKKRVEVGSLRPPVNGHQTATEAPKNRLLVNFEPLSKEAVKTALEEWSPTLDAMPINTQFSLKGLDLKRVKGAVAQWHRNNGRGKHIVISPKKGIAYRVK